MLTRDLEGIFGPRLQSLVAYSGHKADRLRALLPLVDGLGFKDLVSCLPLTESWHHGDRRALMLSADELRRTVDVFPLEYSSIIADYTSCAAVTRSRACRFRSKISAAATEGQAKSTLIHLREAFLESHGETTRIARVNRRASAAPLRGLLTNIARFPTRADGADGSLGPVRTSASR